MDSSSMAGFFLLAILLSLMLAAQGVFTDPWAKLSQLSQAYRHQVVFAGLVLALLAALYCIAFAWIVSFDPLVRRF